MSTTRPNPAPQTPGKPPQRAPQRPTIERFTVTIEAHADPAGWRTPTYRLKLALKLFLRSFGFRCTSISTTPQMPATPAKQKD